MGLARGEHMWVKGFMTALETQNHRQTPFECIFNSIGRSCTCYPTTPLPLFWELLGCEMWKTAERNIHAGWFIILSNLASLGLTELPGWGHVLSLPGDGCLWPGSWGYPVPRCHSSNACNMVPYHAELPTKKALRVCLLPRFIFGHTATSSANPSPFVAHLWKVWMEQVVKPVEPPGFMSITISLLRFFPDKQDFWHWITTCCFSIRPGK